MILYATRVSDDCYELDFRDLFSGDHHIAYGTLFAARCIAALHSASLLLDGVAWDDTDMEDVLPIALSVGVAMVKTKSARAKNAKSAKGGR